MDGVHCPVQEPRHPTKSKDQSYYSHYFKQFGGVDEWSFQSKSHDISNFRNAGLQVRILACHRIIGDRGYIGEPAVICTTNPHDPAELRKFKSRA